MFQLKFNDNFTKLIMDIPYWKEQKDIPKDVIQFINNTSNKRVFYEKSTGNFYCAKCVELLDKNNFCPNCNIKHKQYSSKDILYRNKDIIIIDKITSNNRLLNNTCNYFIFDIIDQDVWLYHIEEEISYDTPFYSKPYKSSKLYIDTTNSYLIRSDGLINLEISQYISFTFLDNCYKESEENFDTFYEKIESSSVYKTYEDIAMTEYNSYLYLDNLIELKSTVYKYSKLWKMTEYLQEQDSFDIAELTLHPLYYPQFEYLVNYKLYDLSLHVPNLFRSGNNFKEIFGIDKKYLPFMSENNISYRNLKILQLCPTTNMEVLEFFSEYIEVYMDYIRELVIKYKVDLTILREYLLSMNLSQHNISDYLDYISMAKELNLDLHNKKVLYPDNLRDAHDELYNQIEIIEDPIIDEKINSISNVLNINKYEDDNYIIYPATSIGDLVEESRQQKNCVRTYCERIANNECQIYFMRKKVDITKSFVTIEICDNKIVQARLKYNKLPSEDIYEILKKWERSLTPVMVS